MKTTNKLSGSERKKERKKDHEKFFSIKNNINSLIHTFIHLYMHECTIHHSLTHSPHKSLNWQRVVTKYYILHKMYNLNHNQQQGIKYVVIFPSIIKTL